MTARLTGPQATLLADLCASATGELWLSARYWPTARILHRHGLAVPGELAGVGTAQQCWRPTDEGRAWAPPPPAHRLTPEDHRLRAMLEEELRFAIIGDPGRASARSPGLARPLGWRVRYTTHSRRLVKGKGGERWVGDAGMTGYPDLTLVRGRRLLYVELKRETEHPTDEQVAWLDDLAQLPSVEVYLWRPRHLERVIPRILGRPGTITWGTDDGRWPIAA